MSKFVIVLERTVGKNALFISLFKIAERQLKKFLLPRGELLKTDRSVASVSDLEDAASNGGGVG